MQVPACFVDHLAYLWLYLLYLQYLHIRTCSCYIWLCATLHKFKVRIHEINFIQKGQRKYEQQLKNNPCKFFTLDNQSTLNAINLIFDYFSNLSIYFLQLERPWKMTRRWSPPPFGKITLLSLTLPLLSFLFLIHCGIWDFGQKAEKGEILAPKNISKTFKKKVSSWF